MLGLCPRSLIGCPGQCQKLLDFFQNQKKQQKLLEINPFKCKKLDIVVSEAFEFEVRNIFMHSISTTIDERLISTAIDELLISMNVGHRDY